MILSTLKFWEKNPALLIALFLLIGTGSALHFHPIYFAVFTALFLPLCFFKSRKKWIVLSLVGCTLGFVNAAYRVPKTVLPSEKVNGIARLQIDEIKPHQSPFQSSLLYRGTLLSFEAENGWKGENLPCQLYTPLYGKHPSADSIYLIEGTLEQHSAYSFFLKPNKKKSG